MDNPKKLKILMVRSLILITVCGLVGCDEPEPARLARPAKAQYECKEEYYNHGYCREGEVISHRFSFVNSGQKKLKVKVKKASCVCVTSEVSKEEFAPGESGSVLVKIDTKGRLGPVIGQVLLETNDDTCSLAILTIKTTVSGAKGTPSAVSFGNVRKGKIAHETLRIKVFGKEDGSIDRVLTDQEAIRLDKSNNLGLSNQTSTEYVAEYKVSLDTQDLPLGIFEGTVTFQMETSMLEVPVSANIHGAFRALPKKLIFGAVSIGRDVEAKCKIRSNNKNPVKILEINGLAQGMSYSTNRVDATKEVILTFSYAPGGKAGLVKGTLMISCAAGTEMGLIQIPYVAVVNKPESGGADTN